MDTILHNQKCWFTADGRLEVYNARLASRLNRYFKKYSNGRYIFKEGEEAIYKVSEADKAFILKNYLSK